MVLLGKTLKPRYSSPLRMALARHETAAKAPETTKNSSYGARSAKRKAPGASGDSSEQNSREARPLPSKKRCSIQNIHNTGVTPAKPESDTPVPTEIPTVPDVPSGLVGDRQRIDTDGLSSTHPTAPPKSTVLVCLTCRKDVKTNSELKYMVLEVVNLIEADKYRKHDLRHRKPIVCQVPGCTRPEGFSSTCDLDRHIKTQHPSAMWNTAKYRCWFQGCKSKEKVWVRLDNFLSHIKHIHRATLSKISPEIQRQVEPTNNMYVSSKLMGNSARSWERGLTEPEPASPLHSTKTQNVTKPKPKPKPTRPRNCTRARGVRSTARTNIRVTCPKCEKFKGRPSDLQ